MTKKIYIWQSKDEYELPFFVTDSLAELEKVCGKTKGQILSLISKKNSGEIKQCAFDRVVIESDSWVKKAMDKKGMTIEELAGILGLSPKTVRQYYMGWMEPGKATRETIKRILDIEEGNDGI